MAGDSSRIVGGAGLVSHAKTSCTDGPGLRAVMSISLSLCAYLAVLLKPTQS